MIRLSHVVRGLVALTCVHCVVPPPGGDLCVYTARSAGQVADEIPLFHAAFPEVKLRCPGTRPDDLYCPSRIADRDDEVRCVDQDAEPWTVLRRSTGSLTELLLQEGVHTPADVIWGVGISHLWTFRDEKSLLQAYEPLYFDRVLATALSFRQRETLWNSFVEPEFWEPNAHTEPVTVGIDAFAAVFCVNEARLQTIVPGWTAKKGLTWADVATDERLRGEVIMPNPTTSGSGFAAIAGILQHLAAYPGHVPSEPAPDGDDDEVPGDDLVANEPSYDDEELLWRFLARLDRQVRHYTRNGDDPCKLAARGEVAIGITHDAADMLPHAGDDELKGGVRRVFPAPDPAMDGARMLGYDVAGIALVDRKDVNLRAAHAFLDWALSPEAVAAYSVKTPFVAYEVQDTPLPPGYPADLRRMDRTRLDFEVLARLRTTYQDEWQRRFCPDPDAERCIYEAPKE